MTLTRHEKDYNTPGTRVGPGFRDRTLATKSSKKQPKINFRKKTFLIFDIPSSYVKKWGREKISPSGVSPKWVKKSRRKSKKEKEEERIETSTNVQ